MIGPVRPTVLLVEDEELVRLVIGDELRDAGYEVLEASNGTEAVDILNNAAAVDLLFTDIRMPGELSGWDVAERARSVRPDIPVIYASGFSDGQPRLVPGACYFKKPYRARAIIEAACGLGVAPAAA